MKITIGGLDYTSALDAAHPLTIERKLNEPSVCRLWIALPANDSATLTRSQPIQVTGDDGTNYFTGYLAASPMPEYAGLGLEGPRYRIALEAISDEYLLDQLPMAPGTGAAGVNAGPLLASLVAKTGSTALSTQALSLNSPVSTFMPAPGATFSSCAGAASNQARAAYRATNGALALAEIPAAVHVLDETQGSLALGNLTLSAGVRRALANDVTVCGEHEPTAYVTEYFLGDGVTTQFNLSSDAFAMPSSKSTIIRELFNEGQIDLCLWGNPGSHNYLSLGAGGLTMQGGTGRDGDTQLSWIDPVEMGGTLLLEASGVTLANGSTGILAGLFSGEQTQPGCTAGFQVTAQQGTGAVSVQPFVMGSPTGSMYSINPSNQYALRVRVHCPECERGLAVYRSYCDSGSISYGGQWNTAPANLLFEIQEFVNGVAGMPITLYDGQIADLPGAMHGDRSQQHQPRGHDAGIESDQPWIRLGGHNAGGRGSGHAPNRHHCSVRRVPRRKHGQTCLLYRLCSACRRADRCQLSRRGQIRRTECEHHQSASSRAGRFAFGLGMDRLGDQSCPTEFAGLPQRRTGHATGGRKRERALERDLQMYGYRTRR